jgi:hypothetical protein
MSRPGIYQSYFFHRVMNSGVVARSARENHVVDVIVTAARMWKEMIILKPQGLECRMLRGVGRTPWEHMRVYVLDSLSDFHADQRDSTKPTMIAVSFVNQLLLGSIRHAHFDALVFR